MALHESQLHLPLQMKRPEKPTPHAEVQNRQPHDRMADMHTRIVRSESKIHNVMDQQHQMHEDLYTHHELVAQMREELRLLAKAFADFKQEWDAESLDSDNEDT